MAASTATMAGVSWRSSFSGKAPMGLASRLCFGKARAPPPDCSTILEGGRPFLGKGVHAFLLIGCSETGMKQAALEAQYKNDPYGGATPEETLKLFIEALEKKDYTLASNYFVPEERTKNLERMPQGVASGGFAALVAAYKQGTVKFTKFSGQNKYEADVIPLGETVGFYFRFVLNEFNKKWLISES